MKYRSSEEYARQVIEREDGQGTFAEYMLALDYQRALREIDYVVSRLRTMRITLGNLHDDTGTWGDMLEDK